MLNLSGKHALLRIARDRKCMKDEGCHMTIKKKNRFYEIVAAVGFLLATVSYSIGSSMLETEYGAAVQGGAHPGALGVGFSLELVNCMAVVLIGILLFLRLRQCGRPIALGYMISRIAEALLLCAGGILVLTGANEALRLQAFLFHLAMVILGVYSAIFCVYLVKWSVGPKWLFLTGVAGYVTLAIYAGSNLISASQLAPMWLFAPGAVFEIIFPVWLIVRGFDPAEA